MNMNEKLDLLLEKLRALSYQERKEIVKEYEGYRADHLRSQYTGYKDTLEVDIELTEIDYNRTQHSTEAEWFNNNKIVENKSFSSFKPNYSEGEESKLNFAA